MYIEDQVGAKRCGPPSRQGSSVSKEEMADRVKAAVDARTDPGFVVMARTDALANEGLERAIERSVRCVEAVPSMIFPEADTDSMYQKFAAAVKAPILANITRVPASRRCSRSTSLRSADVAMILYPLTAFRAMNKAALKVYENLRKTGTQKARSRTCRPGEEPVRHHQLPLLREKAG